MQVVGLQLHHLRRQFKLEVCDFSLLRINLVSESLSIALHLRLVENSLIFVSLDFRLERCLPLLEPFLQLLLVTVLGRNFGFILFA